MDCQQKAVVYTLNDLRTRLNRLGWNVRELPIRSGTADEAKISGYKLIAVKGDKSFQCTGKSLEDGMKMLCKSLGVIA